MFDYSFPEKADNRPFIAITIAAAAVLAVIASLICGVVVDKAENNKPEEKNVPEPQYIRPAVPAAVYEKLREELEEING